jgi:hypothetical protein
MSFTPNFPDELLKGKAMIQDIDFADRRADEMLLHIKLQPNLSDAAKVFFQAVLDREYEIDSVRFRPVVSRWGEDNLIVYADWSGKGNQADIDKTLTIEHWVAVRDGLHNSNSFLTHWREEFWLIHASSPYHFATPECKLILWRSKDARSWTKVREFRVPDEDIRDPKLAVIHDRLMIYVLKSLVEDGSEPYTTAVSYTEDGEYFSELKELFELQGWLFWNPRTFDNKTWYVPAYWGGHGRSIILKTLDGLKFEPLAYIHNGKQGLVNDMNDETDFSFLPDGRLLSTQRLEYQHGINSDPRCCTNITLAEPPYTRFEELGKDYTSRLDGPSMFTYNGRAFSVARNNPATKQGSAINSCGGLTRKRTALYEVTEKGLIFLTDLPSSGDTAYGGCVLKDGFLYASYYSSETDVDWPWLVGMLNPSNICMVKIPLAEIETLAIRRKKEYEEKGLYKFVPYDGTLG